MGLGGVGVPWDEQEESWQLRRSNLEDLTKCSDGGGEGDEDVAPETMADSDSKFVEIGGMRVHYKEALPPPSCLPGTHAATAAATGVVLVHGFGGGVFAWRHVMEPLAMQLQCRVVAFDRPAFGESLSGVWTANVRL